jgi:hypothetical protein
MLAGVGVFLIVLGLWLLPLTFCLYIKYQKDKDKESSGTTPLRIYSILSLLILVSIVATEISRRNSQVMVSP